MRFGLLGRTIVALAAVGILPLAVAAWQLTSGNRKALVDQTMTSLALAASTGANRVETYVTFLNAAADAVGRSPQLAAPNSPAAHERLRDLLEAEPRIKAISIVNLSGAEVVGARQRPLAREMDAVLAVSESATLVAVPAGGQLWIRVERTVPELGLRVRLVADSAKVEEALRPDELGKDAITAVVTRGGDLVLGKNAAAGVASFPPELLASVRVGGLSGAKRYRDPGGLDILASFAPVNGTDWYYLGRVQARTVETAVDFLRKKALLGVGTAVLLAALMGVAAYVTIVKPVRQLVRAQRKLAGRDTGKAGSDEISDLKTSFESLERQIKEQSAVGKVFLGRFQVLELLGAGGMGAVFSGWDPKLQRKVALKTIRLESKAAQTVPQGQDVVGNLVREAVTTASLNHPNVVAVYDVEDSPEAAFVAMELVEGMSLEERLAKVLRVPYQQVTPLGAAIARGLSAAHALGMVHHDVKPANILLGKGGAIKVTDFGIAQLVTSVAQRADVVFGTPGYLPPEALHGEGYDSSGDLFGLGAILYRCLTGNRAFPGKDNKAIVASTLKGDVVPPRQFVPGIPDELNDLVLSLLAKERSARPASAKGVAESLESIAGKAGWRWNASFLEAKPAPPEPGVKPAAAYEKPESVFLPTSRLAAGGGARAAGQPGAA